MSSSHTETRATPASVEVTMPQMGISVSEGTILEWRRQVGESIEADETICDVTTDKVDVEIPSPASGVVERILVEPGETVAVGTVIAEIGAGGAQAGEAAPAGPGDDATDAVPEPTEARDARPSNGNGSSGGERSGFVSPVVRRMATEHGIDLSQVEGHGVGGRIRKKDLLAYLESGGAAAPSEKPARPLHIESPYRPDEPEAPARPTPAPAPAAANGHVPVAGERREPMTPMRKRIAEHMVTSRRTAAHCTTIVEVDFSAVAARRAELKPAFERKGVSLTYLAFVARATVEALEEFPVVNASVDGDEIVYHDAVNLGIAVALPGDAGGLIVPVIRDAQRLSLEGMAAAIGDVATRARERRLEPDDVQGGTFTITNPGQFGAVLATPIINQPQVAILDLEAIVKRPVVVQTPRLLRSASGGETVAEGIEDAIAIRPMAYLPMSWDHRALDGADAARFLSRVKERLEKGEVR